MALTKIDDRGLKTPIDLLDNEKIQFGTGNDLEIYHDGNNSYILNSTGELQLRDQSRIKLRTDQFVINNFANDESIIYAAANGAVELYYDGVKKFETKSTGVGITGELHIPDGEWMRFGTDQLQIRSNANNAYIVEGASGKLQIQASNFELSNAAANKTYLYATDGGSIDLYYDNSKKFETTAAGVRIYNTAAADAELRITASEGRPSVIIMDADDADDNADIWRLKASDDGSYYLQNYASGSYETNIKANGNGNVELYWDNSKKLATTSGGVHIYNALSTSGAISIGNGANLTVEDNGKAVFGFGSDLQIYHDASNSYVTNTTGDLYLITTGDDVIIRSTDDIKLQPKDGESGIQVHADGGVDLYYDGSKKLETTSTGAILTSGAANTTSVRFGNTANRGLEIKTYNSAGNNDSGVVFNAADSENSGYAATLEFDLGGVEFGRFDGNYDIFKLASACNGITFNGDYAAVNRLNDYEEGDVPLTCTSGGLTITANGSGYYSRYIKIGHFVHIQFYIGVGSGTHTSSILELSGLPFTVASGQYSVGIIDIGKGGIKGTYMRAKQGSSTIEFFYPSESNSTQRYQMAGNQIGTGTYLIGTMSYYTTS